MNGFAGMKAQLIFIRNYVDRYNAFQVVFNTRRQDLDSWPGITPNTNKTIKLSIQLFDHFSLICFFLFCASAFKIGQQLDRQVVQYVLLNETAVATSRTPTQTRLTSLSSLLLTYSRCDKAATPGRFLPSSNSKLAPPPVDT
jgi:hypothetical protein